MNPSEQPTTAFSVKDYQRPRWNVLDMITFIRGGSIPTYLWADVDMTWAEEFRKKLKAAGIKTTVTAILLKAIAIAQRSHPESRTCVYPFGKLVTLNNIVAGFTVERFIGNQPAVFFGAIEAPDTKSVEEIAQELQAYGSAEMKDVKHLDTQDRFNNMPWLFRRLILWLGMTFPSVRLRHQNATFGLSSLGKFGIKSVVPPCVSTSTIGIGSVEDRAVVRNGEIVIRPMMTISLNFDHRAIDGAPAARFLQDIIKLMEGGLENYIQGNESLSNNSSSMTSSFT
ncbi:MAG TPA: 2-oxo acid dehydrogenase subunit E2 [Drouetiella sp.]